MCSEGQIVVSPGGDHIEGAGLTEPGWDLLGLGSGKFWGVGDVELFVEQFKADHGARAAGEDGSVHGLSFGVIDRPLGPLRLIGSTLTGLGSCSGEEYERSQCEGR